jgi:hypothetical protein
VSAGVRLAAEFFFDDENPEKVYARLQLEDIKTGRKVEAKEMRFRDRKGEMKVMEIAEDSIYRISCEPEKELQNRLLYIEYDDYYANSHKQYIPVPYPPSGYDVSFWPEGGCFPAGTGEAGIGFKALSADGLGEMIEGRIVDSSGNVRGAFESNVLGMGAFSLKARTGERLYAECKNRDGTEKRFELPAAQQGVYSLGVKRVGGIVNLYVTVASDLPTPNGLYLLLQMRGALLYCQAWNSDRKFLQIRSSDLPSGVLQALLVDSCRNPVSTRLFFNLNKSDLIETELETDRPLYQARQKISSIIRLKEKEEDTIFPEGDLAISVTSDRDVMTDTANTIVTAMLLTSELKGNIENPGFYFSGNDLKRPQDMDYLMLTQGWSRYNIRSILKDSLELPRGQLEIGPEISGTVGGGGGIRGRKNGYQISATTFSPPAYEMTETDETGRFRLTTLEMPENTRFLIQALMEKGMGTGTLDLRLDPESYPPVSQKPLWRYGHKQELENYKKNVEEQYLKTYGERMIYLDEVVVKARKRGKSYLSAGSARIISQDQIEKISAETLYTLLRAIPSIGKYPLIIDGVPVEPFVAEEKIENTFNNNFKLDAVRAGYDEGSNSKGDIEERLNPYWTKDEFVVNMPKEYIEELEVVEPNSPGAFNVQSKVQGRNSFKNYIATGALLITTKARNGGFSTRDDLNKKTIVPLGYQLVKEFYSPRYETADDSNKVPFDMRTTIYWNPSVKTNGGEVSFDFYAADTPAGYTVTVEGMSKSGKLIRLSRKIRIDK